MLRDFAFRARYPLFVALLCSTACTTTVDAPGSNVPDPGQTDPAASAAPEPVAATAQADTVQHQYTFSIDNFWVTYPRSKYTDTITAGLSVGWADPASLAYTPQLHASQYVGNIAHGGVNIPGFARTIIIANPTLVKIGVGLENRGNPSYAFGQVANVVVGAEWTHSLEGIGPTWPANPAFSKNAWLGGAMSDCDGVVAGDGAVVTGAELEALTASGAYTRTVMFPGTDSASGCGRNSLYYMTWTIRRNW